MINTLCFTEKLILPQTFRLLNVINQAKSSLRNYSARRCILEVPACNPKKIDAALQVRVDCLNFSLFNLRHVDLKDYGRTTLQAVLNEKKIVDDETEWCVRVHPVQYQEDFIQDIDMIFSAKNLPSAISLPHINNCKQLEWFFQEIDKKKELLKSVAAGRKINLLLEITSPKGIMRLEEICEEAKSLAESKSTNSLSFQFSALIYGYDTLKKHLGCNRTPGGLECLYSRQKLVLIAKAFGLQAIDFPNNNVEGEKELENECHDGVVLGFTGKMVNHPKQVGVVQSIFSPSRTRIGQARNIAKLYITPDEGVSSGKPPAPSELSLDPEEFKVAKYVLEMEHIAGKYRTDKI